jgi:hypothetical protein
MDHNQLKDDLLPPHGYDVAAAVHFAQEFVHSYVPKPWAGIMGTEVSYFAHYGLVPARTLTATMSSYAQDA